MTSPRLTISAFKSWDSLSDCVISRKTAMKIMYKLRSGNKDSPENSLLNLSGMQQ